MDAKDITHQIGDRVLVLHNIPLGNLIGTVTAIHYATYEVTLDGGGKSNMFGFQLQPLPEIESEDERSPSEWAEENLEITGCVVRDYNTESATYHQDVDQIDDQYLK
jgi:hypothetical protein